MDMSSFLRMLQFKRKMLPHAQLLRWSNWFSQWKFTVKHIKGTENVLADFLSRPKAYKLEENASRVKHIKGTENVLADFLSRPKAYKLEENYSKDASRVQNHTLHFLLMVFSVTSQKEDGSSSNTTPTVPVFDLPEEIVETIGDLTFEKRAKVCYKTFLTILLKNHGLCIKGLRFHPDYPFLNIFHIHDLWRWLTTTGKGTYVLVMFRRPGSFLPPKAINDDGSAVYHAPYCFIHDWYKVNPSSKKCERNLQTLYTDRRAYLSCTICKCVLLAASVVYDDVPKYLVIWHAHGTKWRSWKLHGQIIRYIETYSNIMMYATVKGGGHTASEYKPEECFAMKNVLLCSRGINMGMVIGMGFETHYLVRGRGRQKRYWEESETQLLIEVLQEITRDPSLKTDNGFRRNYTAEVQRRLFARLIEEFGFALHRVRHAYVKMA
nr:serine carboxypeptidase-like 13 isoform X1 [Tanacetum cinerariifolium]